MKLWMFAIIATPLAVLVPPAQAQDPPPDSTVVLPPLRVTATRSSRPLLDQPLAITRIDQQTFREGGSGYGLDGALARVPGVVVQSRYGTSDVRIVIRGFGARGAGDRSNAGTSRGIRVLLDGFPETEPDGRTSFDGIDLASALSIEVVRSNASSVWGNAAGGVIQVSTVGPLSKAFGAVEPAFGSFGLRRTAVRGGSPLGAGQVSASVITTDWDGWRAHSSSHRTLVNTSVTSPLGDRSQLGVFLVASSHLFRVPGPLTRAEVENDPQQANAVYAARDERRFNRVGRLGVRLEHRLGGGSEISSMLFVNPKFLQRSERGTFRDFTRYHVGGNLVFTNRSRLSPRLESTLDVGVDEAFQDGAILFYDLSPTGNRGETLRTNKREGANNFGVFVQEELVLDGRVGLSVGARFDDITYFNDDNMKPSLNDTKSFRGVTPKLGVNWRITPTRSVYASIGGGVEAPAGNETDPVSTFGQDSVTALNPLLEPIRSTTVEIGTKAVVTLGSALLSYDVALYSTGVRNEIVPYRGGRFYFTAGRVRRHGAEFGARLTTGGWETDGALTLNRHRYTEYVVDSVHYGRPGAFADFGGHKLVGVPDVTWSGSLGYTWRELRGLHAQVAIQGMGAYFADDANLVPVESYRTVSATVALRQGIPLGSGMSLRGFVTVNNLFDASYIGSAFLNPDVVNGQPVAFEPGSPRTLIVGATLGSLPVP